VAEPDVVFLSPHLDDAVLSTGALIARHAAEGQRVEVWTFFTSGPSPAELPPSRRVFGDYATRLIEDERATGRLGAGQRWLGFIERIWREPRLTNTLHVFRTPESPDELVNVPAMREVIGGLLARPGVTIYAPLAVGNHHDHVEVALAAAHELVERRAFDRLFFYEDPYATGTGCRSRHFLTRRRMWSLLDAPAWASPRVGALLRLVALSERGPGIDAYLPEVAELEWTCTPQPLGEYEEVKLAAIAEYGSQVSEFGGPARLTPFVRRAHELLGGEPVWRARG